MRTKLIISTVIGIVFWTFLGSIACAAKDKKKAIGEVKGAVKGHTLNVKDAIFMWHDKANDMSIILSDREGLCELLTSGNWPRGATLLYFILKHNPRENQDSPFSAGEYPLRTKGSKHPQDTKSVIFIKFDETCKSSLSKRESRAISGKVQIKLIDFKPGSKASGEFQLKMGKGGEELQGHFSASFCAMSKEYQEPRGCK